MYGKEPNCEECIPKILPENREIVNVYLHVHNQHIMGFSGPVDLNLSSLSFVMDVLDVKDKKYVFEKVHRVYRYILKKMMDQAKLDRLEKQLGAKGMFH